MHLEDYSDTNLQNGLRSEEKSGSQLNQKATVVNKQSVKAQAKVVANAWEQCTEKWQDLV